MDDAVIVDAVRTAGGKRNGKLSGWHPVSLAAFVLNELVDRNNLDPAVIDDVIMGCVMQVSEQAANIARNAVLAAGWSESVMGTTIDRQCGSSQQAMHFAAQGVMAGAYDIVIAAGVESMSRVPMNSSWEKGDPWSPEQVLRYGNIGMPNQGLGAEMIADEYGITRHDLDEFGAQSQQRAAAAALKPAFKEGGKITAGNSSQICDGASATLIMSASKAAELGLRPRARFHSFALAGADPITMLKGPIPATRKILAKSGLTLDDIDVVEINEAFASVVLGWQRDLGTELTKVNPNGGAIALGHPLGSSGTKLMATMLNELERTKGRFGLQLMCEGGGMANATIIERLDE